MFFVIRCEGSSIPLADEALVRKRKEELKHAQVSWVMVRVRSTESWSGKGQLGYGQGKVSQVMVRVRACRVMVRARSAVLWSV